MSDSHNTPAEQVRVYQETIQVDNAYELERLSNGCKVTLAMLRNLHGLKDRPNDQLLVALDGESGGVLASESADRVAIKVGFGDKSDSLAADLEVTVVEAIVSPEGDTAINVLDDEGELTRIKANDTGVGVAASLLKELIRANQYKM